MPALHDSRAFVAFLVTLGVAALFIGQPRAQEAPAKEAPVSEAPAKEPEAGKPPPPAVAKPPKAPPKKASDTTQPTKRPPDREVGMALYKQSCWQCHGEKGLGDGPAAAALVGGVPSLVGRIRSKDAESLEDFDALVNAVQNGKGRMPAYSEDIDKADTRRILLYVRDVLEGKEIKPEAEAEGGDDEGGDAPGGQ